MLYVNNKIKITSEDVKSLIDQNLNLLKPSYIYSNCRLLSEEISVPKISVVEGLSDLLVMFFHYSMIIVIIYISSNNNLKTTYI